MQVRVLLPVVGHGAVAEAAPEPRQLHQPGVPLRQSAAATARARTHTKLVIAAALSAHPCAHARCGTFRPPTRAVCGPLAPGFRQPGARMRASRHGHTRLRRDSGPTKPGSIPTPHLNWAQFRPVSPASEYFTQIRTSERPRAGLATGRRGTPDSPESCCEFRSGTAPVNIRLANAPRRPSQRHAHNSRINNPQKRCFSSKKIVNEYA